MPGAQKHPSDPKPSIGISPLPCTLPSSDLISFPKNLVQQGIDTYKTLRERRRMLHCKHTLPSLFNGEQPTVKEWRLTPAAARQAAAFTTEMEIVIGFLRALEPFRVLSVDDQLILTKSFSKKFRILETYYNTYRNGGHRANRLYRTDYTFLDLAPKEEKRRTNEESLTAAEDEWPAGWGPSQSAFQIGDATMSNIWHAKFREGLKHIAAQMESIGMADAEFAALALMTVFDPS
ncbi:hypothetical protein AAVH_28569 [Aphelenchoides avenae]|nr:hypothetical protein AAVH_28569 [Aphelenchus avenae]